MKKILLCRTFLGLAFMLGWSEWAVNADVLYVTGWGIDALRQLEPPPELPSVTKVAAGFGHALALSQGGTVTAWGDNSSGQATVPAALSNVVSVACGFRHSLALRANGTVAGWGDNSFGQAQFSGPTNLVAVAAGGFHSLGLCADGTVVAWGSNTYGQASVPSNLGPVQAIAAGAYHSVALRSNGTVVTWGYLGNTVPGWLSNVVAMASGFNHNLALRADGTVVAWGQNGNGQTNVPAGLSNVVAIAAGRTHSLALRQDGSVCAWGGNDAGESAVPEALARVQALSAGAGFSLALVPGPAVIRQPVGGAIVPASTMTLSTQVAGAGPLQLQWQRNGVDLPAQTNLTLILTNIQYSQEGQYRLRIGSSAGVLYSQNALLTAPPVIVSQPQSGQVYYDSNFTFQVTAAGTAPISCQWFFTNAPLAEATNATLAITNAAYAQNGSYYVVLSNCAGVATSAVATLTLRSQPSIIWRSPTTSVAYDDTLYLGYSIAGVGPDTVQWQWNGLNISNPPVSELRIDHARPSHAGTYRLLAISAAGTVYSDEVVVAVSSANPTGYVGRPMLLDAGTAHGLARGFRWFHNGTEVAGQTNSTLGLDPLSPSDAGSYIVAGRFDDGERTYDAAQVSVLPPPGDSNSPAILVQPVGGVVEIGTNFLFQVRSWSAAPQSFQWYHNGLEIPGATQTSLLLTNIQLTDAGNYSVLISTLASNVVSDSAILLVNPPPYLSLPARRGAAVAWGQYVPGSGDVPWGLGEVASISSDTLGTQNFAIRRDGTVVSWGTKGQFRLPVTNLVRVVTYGNNGFLGLRNNGVVGLWNSLGAELTPPANLRDLIQLVSNGTSYMGLCSNGTIIHAFAANFFPSGLSNVVQVALGQYHGVALRADGTVVLSKLGYPSEQTAVPAGLSNVVSVAAGAQHTLALQSNGIVVAWGRNVEKQCTVPAGLSNVVAVAAGGSHSMALRADGTVCVWGNGAQGQWNVPPSLTNVAAIAAGYNSCLALQRGPALLTPLPDLNVAPGQPATFQVQAEGAQPLTYQWRFQGTGIPGATNSSLTVTASDATAGLYSVSVANAQGSVMADAMLWLAQPPEIVAQPDDLLVRAYSTANLMVLAAGVGPLKYQWQFNGTNIAKATNALYAISSATSANEGDYCIVITNPVGSTTSRLAHLSVCYSPYATIQPTALTAAVGESATFSATLSGTAPVRCQWRCNGTDLPGATNISLILTNITLADAGTYSVSVSNWAGAYIRGNAVLTVVAAEPQFVSVPASQTVSYGADIIWQVAVTGASPLSYQWFFNGAPLSGATAPRLVLGPADEHHAGLYQVAVRNSFGAITSAPASLSLQIPPNVIAWGSNDVGQLNVPASLTNAVAVAASRHSLALRADGTVAAWGANESGQATLPAGLSNVVALAAGYNHSLALRNDGTIVAWGDNTYGQTNVPTGLSNVLAIAASDLHSLALKPDGTVVGWGYGGWGSTTPPADLTNAVGLATCYDHSLALRADGTVVGWGNYYGEPAGLSNVVAIAGGPRFLALRADGSIVGWTSGNYGQLLTEGPLGPLAISSGSGNVGTQPHQLALLPNRTVAVWGGNNNSLFTPPTNLANVVAIAAGSWHNLAVRAGPVLLRQPQDLSIGAGDTLFLEVGAISSLPLSYQWAFNGTNLPGQTNAFLTWPAAQPAQSGNYTVLVSDSVGLVQSRAARLTVQPDAPFILGQPASQAVLQGAAATFQVEALGAFPLSCQWFHNGTPILGATQSVLSLPATAASDAGLYSVRVANVFGQTASQDALLSLGIQDIVVDNAAAQVVGSWQSGFNPNQLGTNFLFAGQGSGANLVRFVPTLPRSGAYQVYTHGFDQPAPRLITGTLLITHATGSTALNPEILPGWSPLGAYNFNAGTSGSVSVTDTFADSAAFCVADAVLFRYQPVPPAITRQPVSAVAQEGGPVTFAAEADGNAPLNYQWQFNQANLAGAAGPTLLLSAVTRAQAGSYRVLVSNTDGALFSQEVQLQIVAPSLRFGWQAGKLVLDWDGTASLQMATNAAGPFWDLTSAAKPFEVDPKAPQQFFRLTH